MIKTMRNYYGDRVHRCMDCHSTIPEWYVHTYWRDTCPVCDNSFRVCYKCRIFLPKSMLKFVHRWYKDHLCIHCLRKLRKRIADSPKVKHKQWQAHKLAQYDPKTITSKQACVAVSCYPASQYLREVCTKHPEFDLERGLEILHDLEDALHRANKYTIMSVKTAVALYLAGKATGNTPTHGEICQSCETTEGTFRRWKKFYLDAKERNQK